MSVGSENRTIFAFIRDASCVPERQAAWLADPSDQNRGFMSWEGITAAGQRPDSHRDFAAFSGPQMRGVDEYIGAQG